MRTLATDATADQLLDHLASNGAGGKWNYFADLGEWKSRYNLRDERYFVSSLAEVWPWPDRCLSSLRATSNS